MNTSRPLTQLLARTLTNAAAGVGLFGMLAVMGPAPSFASERSIEIGDERVTAVTMDDYSESQIVRERSEGKESVTFSAMAGAIDEAAVVVFDIDSVGKSKSVHRWRCVAKHNIEECFANPVRIKYLKGDERVVMKVRIQSAELPVAALARR